VHFTSGRSSFQRPLKSKPILEEIADYRDAGLPCFPLLPRSKRPVSKGWRRRATSDTELACQMFTRHPKAGVGLLMGTEISPECYVFALDVDFRSEGDISLRKLIRLCGKLPDTPIVITPGGGLHYYLTSSSAVRSGPAGREWPGIDLKGVGGYVVAPPSIHPNGRPYRHARRPHDGFSGGSSIIRTLRPSEPVAGIVVPARPIVIRPSRRGEVDAHPAGMIARFPIPAIHTRHPLMLAVVGSLLGRGVEDDDVRAVVTGWAEHFRGLGVVAADPSGVEVELAKMIACTRRNAKFTPGVSEVSHREACKAIILAEVVGEKIKPGSVEFAQTTFSCEGLTRIQIRLV